MHSVLILVCCPTRTGRVLCSKQAVWMLSSTIVTVEFASGAWIAWWWSDWRYPDRVSSADAAGRQWCLSHAALCAGARTGNRAVPQVRSHFDADQNGQAPRSGFWQSDSLKAKSRSICRLNISFWVKYWNILDVHLKWFMWFKQQRPVCGEQKYVQRTFLLSIKDGWGTEKIIKHEHFFGNKSKFMTLFPFNLTVGKMFRV